MSVGFQSVSSGVRDIYIYTIYMCVYVCMYIPKYVYIYSRNKKANLFIHHQSHNEHIDYVNVRC